MALKGYGDTGTEWHALFAENHDAALVLNEQLFILMTELEVADTHEYHILGGFLRKVVLQNCYQGFDGRGISNGRELKEEAKQIFAVYVLITPGLHGDNRGITGTRGTIRFSITIKAAKTQKSTAYEFAAERFQSHIPSFSYNGFRVKNAKEQRRAVKKMREYFEMVLQDMKDTDAEHYGTQHEIECAIDDDDRYWVKGKDLDRTLLREYVDWFDEGPIDLLAYNRPANPNPLSLRSWKPVSLEENMKKQQIEEEGEEAEEAEVGEVDDWDNMFDEA
ncbi:hypothetical protein FRC07_000234 [Ceratobasidium sp. 392]|nr:hypothetical protein FRC07_000234 [Ceratobasidium sp. 392]